MISSSTLIVSRNSHVAKPRCAAKSTIFAGMPEPVIQCPNTSAVAMISMMTPALRSASAITSSVRLTGKPR